MPPKRNREGKKTIADKNGFGTTKNDPKWSGKENLNRGELTALQELTTGNCQRIVTEAKFISNL
jgi:hypothetical protein